MRPVTHRGVDFFLGLSRACLPNTCPLGARAQRTLPHDAWGGIQELRLDGFLHVTDTHLAAIARHRALGPPCMVGDAAGVRARSACRSSGLTSTGTNPNLHRRECHWLKRLDISLQLLVTGTTHTSPSPPRHSRFHEWVGRGIGHLASPEAPQLAALAAEA